MIPLPDAVAAYVAAANEHDAARVAGCFVRNGTVYDEGRLRRGHAAIAAWASETATRYQSVIAPAGIAGQDGRHELTASVSGNFPGSPATLKFRFVLRAERIEALEITA
ncbi:nuclear transport factor 2 family protein [Pseudoduganella lutea]|uniref:Nuclear transport factor 2 family protein n=1 Tax=Pseudoduganella lutea TaxID=321985 RepID=A0A4P6L2N5_9BURK|nr:nuclear transport factor 2 family protein [Pseudoduganella lutea]QBE65886.1 nuclear transport factor 2 family protein [Pseudoduganella lutea]